MNFSDSFFNFFLFVKFVGRRFDYPKIFRIFKQIIQYLIYQLIVEKLLILLAVNIKFFVKHNKVLSLLNNF